MLTTYIHIVQTAKPVQTTIHLRKWSHQIIKKIAPLISRHPYFFHSENVPWCPIICVSVLDRSNFWIMRIEDSSATYIMLKLWTCPTIGHRVRPSPSEKTSHYIFWNFWNFFFLFFFLNSRPIEWPVGLMLVLCIPPEKLGSIAWGLSKMEALKWKAIPF